MLPIAFWEKVQRGTQDECWPWLAGTCQGYGHLKFGDKVKKAHRVVYEDLHGQIPRGLVVMHSCDNRRCVNPAHLSLGTPKENNRDRDAKGRQVAPKGPNHGMSKLTQEQAKELAAFRAEIGRNVREFAANFSVTETTIRDVLAGRTWKHLAL